MMKEICQRIIGKTICGKHTYSFTWEDNLITKETNGENKK